MKLQSLCDLKDWLEANNITYDSIYRISYSDGPGPNYYINRGPACNVGVWLPGFDVVIFERPRVDSLVMNNRREMS